MARKDPLILLGYDDKMITDKHKGQVNFTTNKIGGKPDLPSDEKLEAPLCPLCQLPRPLVVQIYAPLENSLYHRTLYVFACINPNCWSQNESWVCLRTQTLEKLDDSKSGETVAVQKSYAASATDWCADADDWGDGNGNGGEENGNLINNSNVEKISDEEEESCSLEAGFGNLNVDDKNANPGTEIQGIGATGGRLHSPAATAEIEGDEGEIVTIDTPTYPQNDISSVLHEALPLPKELCQDTLENRKILQFIPYFVSVWEETLSHSSAMDEHVRELLAEYQNKNEEVFGTAAVADNNAASDSEVVEKYEKSNPAHGDKMFHGFLTRISQNPGQILRYNREGNPLLMYPLPDVPHRCQHCQGEMVFEFQILSTMIPKLRLPVDGREGARLEYGTVLIYTCRQSCWSSNAVIQQEAVVVQVEN